MADRNLFEFTRTAPTVLSMEDVPRIRPSSSALSRFAKNRGSLVGAIIICLLVLFSLTAPLLTGYRVDFRDGYYRNMPPIFLRTLKISGPQGVRDYYEATGALKSVVSRIQSGGNDYYDLRVDAYDKVGYLYVDLSPTRFTKLLEYQNTTGLQVCYPIPRNHNTAYPAVPNGANLWYQLADDSRFSAGASAYHDAEGQPIFVENYLTDDHTGFYTSLRLADDPGNWVYAVKNQTGYRCRVLYAAYYRYEHGFAPLHIFGTNQHGQDIFICLAAGARLSLGLSISVSLINLLIGLLYGAAEGYYGGKTDLFMERFADILASIPFIVVATLFQLHLSARVGAVPSLLFSFVLTGWIGIAARVRTQFYRFKGSEYVLCSRTLGAKDRRIIFRHILPNAVGTIITAAVLLIPGVIFSESMLSYLGIVDLESGNLTSLGTMLAAGRGYLGTYPHILIFPALFISLLEISFNLLGNGLRDAFNPLLKDGQGR